MEDRKTVLSSEAVEFLVGLNDEDKALIALGRKDLRLDPTTERLEIIDLRQTGPNCPGRLHVNLNLSDAMIEERKDLVPELAGAISFTAQLYPDRFAKMLNTVRSDFDLPAIVEPDVHHGKYEGTAIAQNKSETILRDKQGRNIALRHETLESKPTANAMVRVTFRPDEMGKVETLRRESDQGKDKGSDRSM